MVLLYFLFFGINSNNKSFQDAKISERFLLNRKSIDSIENGITIMQDFKAITSIHDLCKRFPEKYILIDIWATWCEPCKEEFRYSNDLFNFLRELNIELVFISWDEQTMSEQWLLDIHHYNLKGKHMIASKLLKDALASQIWGSANGYSIPNYSLIDTHGRFLIKSGLPPSKTNELYNSITDKLNNKLR